MTGSTGPLEARAHADGVRCAERVAGACAEVVEGAVAGVVLHGSLTLGDFVPGRSDVDVLVVVEEPLAAADVAALTAALDRESPRAPGPVDLRVVTRAVATAPTTEPPMELYVRLRGPAGVRLEGHRVPERDLVVELSVCRAHGVGLLGPAPAALLAPVPDEWVDAAGDAQLADWQAAEWDPRYAELVALTACRVWRFAEERRHSSKRAAAEWVLARAPALRAAREALRLRAGDPAAAIEEASVRELLAAARVRASGGRSTEA